MPSKSNITPEVIDWWNSLTDEEQGSIGEAAVAKFGGQGIEHSDTYDYYAPDLPTAEQWWGTSDAADGFFALLSTNREAVARYYHIVWDGDPSPEQDDLGTWLGESDQWKQYPKGQYRIRDGYGQGGWILDDGSEVDLPDGTLVMVEDDAEGHITLMTDVEALVETEDGGMEHRHLNQGTSVGFAAYMDLPCLEPLETKPEPTDDLGTWLGERDDEDLISSWWEEWVSRDPRGAYDAMLEYGQESAAGLAVEFGMGSGGQIAELIRGLYNIRHGISEACYAGDDRAIDADVFDLWLTYSRETRKQLIREILLRWDATGLPVGHGGDMDVRVAGHELVIEPESSQHDHWIDEFATIVEEVVREYANGGDWDQFSGAGEIPQQTDGDPLGDWLKDHIDKVLIGKDIPDMFEVSPPGWEGTVKAMKKHKDIDNPWSLAWSMKNKGNKAHYSSRKPFNKKKGEGIHPPATPWEKHDPPYYAEEYPDYGEYMYDVRRYAEACYEIGEDLDTIIGSIAKDFPDTSSKDAIDVAKYVVHGEEPSHDPLGDWLKSEALDPNFWKNRRARWLNMTVDERLKLLRDAYVAHAMSKAHDSAIYNVCSARIDDIDARDPYMLEWVDDVQLGGTGKGPYEAVRQIVWDALDDPDEEIGGDQDPLANQDDPLGDWLSNEELSSDSLA